MRVCRASIAASSGAGRGDSSLGRRGRGAAGDRRVGGRGALGLVLGVLVAVAQLSPLPAAASSAGVSSPLRPVLAFGANGGGQLGNGTTTNSSTPVRVTGLTGVVAVAAGGAHTLALRSDGTVWAWGDNNAGELGNGATIDTGGVIPWPGNYSSTPVRVLGLTGVVAVAAGDYHSLAVLSDGTVRAWGWNQMGQLGTGNSYNRSTPTQVSGLTGVVAVAGGYEHSLALRSDGTVWAWGSNNHGQLGKTTTQLPLRLSLTPVQVKLTGIVAVRAGEYHSLARRSDGTVRAWGYNAYGQLGDGTTADEYAPVQVTSINHGGEELGTGPASNDSLVIGQPYAIASPSSLAFPAAQVGSVSSSQTVTVTNAGAAPLLISAASLVGQDANAFQTSGDGCSGTTVAVGASCTIGIQYSPIASGPASAQLQISSNGPTPYPLVALSGTPLPGPTSPSRTASVTCTPAKIAPGTLTLTCRLATTAGKRRHTLTIRLSRGTHTIATATTARSRARTLAVRLRLPHGLTAGRCILTITITNPTTHTTQELKLAAVPRPARQDTRT